MRIALAPGDDPVAAVRGAAAASVVLVVAPGRSPLDEASWRAAIAPLAIEQAPGRRVNAVAVGPGADAAAVDAAVTFLDAARAITGQVVAVDQAGARDRMQPPSAAITTP